MPHRRRNNRRVTAIRQPCYARDDQHGIREVCNKRALYRCSRCQGDVNRRPPRSCGTDMGT
eukprot:2322628-Prymnesium_polylepis.1